MCVCVSQDRGMESYLWIGVDLNHPPGPPPPGVPGVRHILSLLWAGGKKYVFFILGLTVPDTEPLY